MELTKAERIEISDRREMENIADIKEFLDSKYYRYNTAEFIEKDPISIPHLFSKKEDIEIAGFLSAVIAWGQRKTIVSNARKLVERMDDSPHDFVTQASDNELKPFASFVHRTFNGIDCIYFLKALQHLYKVHGGLEYAFSSPVGNDFKDHILHFRRLFFEITHSLRTEKHIANPAAGSSAKRINMFLRWMVRKDNAGVDFGIWKNHDPAGLYCPLDVHSGNVARKLSLLRRKQNDWKAVEELTGSLRKFDASDPVKYDFALFGLGIYEKF